LPKDNGEEGDYSEQENRPMADTVCQFIQSGGSRIGEGQQDMCESHTGVEKSGEAWTAVSKHDQTIV